MSIKLCLLSLSVSIVAALGPRKALHPDTIYGTTENHFEKVMERRRSEGLGVAQSFNFTQRLDHFNNTRTETFNMRYLIDTNFYNSTKAPILFYAGNEGDITNFYDNTGFFTQTLAEKWGALLVFAEHRYYGTSMPFNSKS